MRTIRDQLALQMENAQNRFERLNNAINDTLEQVLRTSERLARVERQIHSWDRGMCNLRDTLGTQNRTLLSRMDYIANAADRIRAEMPGPQSSAPSNQPQQGPSNQGEQANQSAGNSQPPYQESINTYLAHAKQAMSSVSQTSTASTHTARPIPSDEQPGPSGARFDPYGNAGRPRPLLPELSRSASNQNQPGPSRGRDGTQQQSTRLCPFCNRLGCKPVDCGLGIPLSRRKDIQTSLGLCWQNRCFKPHGRDPCDRYHLPCEYCGSMEHSRLWCPKLAEDNDNL